MEGLFVGQNPTLENGGNAPGLNSGFENVKLYTQHALLESGTFTFDVPVELQGEIRNVPTVIPTLQ